jgi:putative polyhydroxyalkanoate system protein
MQQPIQVDMPHSLGKDEARRRIANNIHKLKDHIPGGAAHVTSSWEGDNLNLTIHAVGQAVDARLGVDERVIHVHVMLPGILAMFAGPIEAMLKKKGSDLLLDDKSK